MSNIYAYVEILPEGYRWALIGRSASPEFSEGDREAVITWVLSINEPVVLVIPGEQVVVRQVPYSEKEKRHFAKLLPYELEEDIIENVDDIHFAVGAVFDSVATVAYVREQFFAEHWQIFSDENIIVERCVIDFQALPTEESTVTLWLSAEGRILANTHDGRGFAVQEQQALNFLLSLISSADYKKIVIYSDSDSLPDYFDALPIDDIELIHYQQPPQLSLSQDTIINFCCGEYQYRPPLFDDVKGFKIVGIMALLAIFAFVGVNWYEGVHLQKENIAIEKQIESLARQVIPRGNINDAVRQLTQKLKGSSQISQEPSHLVFLLAKVSPLVSGLNIELTTIKYSDKDKLLRINVKAESFGLIESFYKKVAEKGFDVELKNSNAVDQYHQARLHISKGGVQ